jgi:hypothetical protein
MGKKDLKLQHPWANLNYIDFLSLIDPSKTNKYLPFMVSRLKESILERNERNKSDLPHVIDDISESYGLNKELFKEYDYETINKIYTVCDIFGRENISTLFEFHEHMENNRIENNDITKYTSFEQIREQVKIASFKQAQKELKDSTHKVYEDDHWVMIKPLTFLSSLKYGAGTKWCTAMNKRNNYFYNYSSDGILIYIINKVNHNKIATHIKLNNTGSYDNIMKFYNEEDREIDSYVSGLPKRIMEKLMLEYRLGKTNLDFIRENYPDIYEKEWSHNVDEKYVGLVTEEAVPSEPMGEPTALVFENPPVQPNLEINIQRGISLSGPISLDNISRETLRSELFQGENDITDIVEKFKKYISSNKIKNLWRKLFGKKLVIIQIPVGTIPEEHFDSLGEKLNAKYGSYYMFMVLRSHHSQDITFQTL